MSIPARARPVRRAAGTLLVVLAVLATACGTDGAGTPSPLDSADQATASTDTTAPSGAPSGAASTAPDVELADFDQVLAEAQGQTVQWWLFGGDDRINAYIDDHVVPAAAERGVTLQRVPITDTADAVQRVVAEVRADESAGSVDMIWINGENFAAGKDAGLWLQDWARDLPNATLVAPETVDTDFGVAVDGQESPWSRALFTFAHDTARVPDAPTSLDALLNFARANPGRVTYPAPPDFTGSAFVRQVVEVLGEDDGFAWLQELQPLLWKQGRTHPASEAELNQLFANGEVDLAMSYDPGFIQTAVAQGTFPDTTRPFVLDTGTLNNVSYVTIPANATHRAGALVVADLLLEPDLQAVKANPDVLGVPTVLDLDLLTADQQRAFRAVDSPYLLDEPEMLLEEVAADEVEAIERRWRAEVLS